MAQAMRQSSLEGKLEVDVEIKSPAEKFYNMFVKNPQDLVKASPDYIKGCDQDAGKFVKVDGHPKVMKQRIDAMEPEKNLISSNVVGGDLMKEFKSFVFITQAIPNQSGPGSVVKCTLKYERIDENVAHPENLLSKVVKLYKDMDEILLSQV